MELRTLKYFVATAEEGSIRRAAERLRIAQPALSRQIRGLEEELGSRFFERSAQGVRLTPAGLRFYREISAALEGIDRVCSSVRECSGPVAPLRIGIAHTISKFPLVREGLDSFRKQSPDTPLLLKRARSVDLIVDIKAGELDLVLLYEQGSGAQNLSVKALLSEKIVLAMPPGHRLAGRQEVQLADLVNEPFVWFLSDRGQTSGNVMKMLCRAQNFEPKIVQEVSSFEAQLELVSMGVGCAFSPESTSLLIPPERLALRPIADFAPLLHLNMMWDAQESRPGLSDLVECLSDAADTAREI